MRTISGTLSTREEAETARRRLGALGIEGEQIGFQEVGEPGAGDGAGIFVTVKVAPEQVNAATDILKGGGTQAARPLPHAGEGPRIETRSAAPQASLERRIPAEAPPPRPVASSHRDTQAPLERVERRPAAAASEARAVPAKDRQPSTVRLARMAAIAALLAGLGFASGAALGILF